LGNKKNTNTNGDTNEGDKKPQTIPIDKITDIELLNKMKKETSSRGKKQRIKKRIEMLTATKDLATKPQNKIIETAKKIQEEQEKPKPSPKEKVHTLLKKREDKLKNKEEKRKYNGVTPEEKVIMKKIKNKKKDTKKKRARETDEFDSMLNKYKSKFLKKFEANLIMSGNDGKTDLHEE
jgi:hypothetical protein